MCLWIHPLESGLWRVVFVPHSRAVQERSIMERFHMLTSLQSRWVDFDVVGKRLFLDQVCLA